MDLDTLICDCQRAAGALVDGKPGLETWTKIRAKLLPGSAVVLLPAAPTPANRVDERSEKNIATLHPRVAPYARALVQRAAAQGLTIRIISGSRTYAEQDALYAQGRTASGPRVTNARAGYSNHNFGLAFDIGLFQGARYVPESPAYKAIGALGADLGLEWGGDWKSIVDEPHFQLRPVWAAGMSESALLTELRRRKDAGTDAFA